MMNLNDNDRITSVGLMVLLFSVMIGFGMLRMPYTVVKSAGHNGWLAIIAAGGIVIIGTVLYTYLGQLFPGQTIVGYSKEIVGPFLGGILILIFVIHWLILAAYEVWAMLEFANMYILKGTPDHFLALILLILFVPFYRNGLEPLTRAAIILFIIIIGPIMVLILMGGFVGDYAQIQPIGRFIEAKGFFKAMRGASLPFLGFEIIAIFLPFVKDREGILKKNILVIVFITTLYTAITIICIAYFRVGELNRLPWSVIALVRSIDVKIQILDSLEVLFIGLWALVSFTSFAIVIEASMIALSELFKFREIHFWVVLMMPIIFIIALIRDNIIVGIELIKQTSEISFIYVMVVPLFLLIAAKMRKKGINQLHIKR